MGWREKTTTVYGFYVISGKKQKNYPFNQIIKSLLEKKKGENEVRKSKEEGFRKETNKGLLMSPILLPFNTIMLPSGDF